jgi:RNA polymerase sigma factor (sigma-70 family)
LVDAGANPARLSFDDAGAFADSIEQLLPIGFRLAFAMLRNRVDAEDVVQEAGMKAWQKRRTFRAGAEPRPWFLAIVANECRMAVRRRGRAIISELKPEDAPTSPLVADRDEVDLLRRALARLNGKDRLALVLRYYLDLSTDEVARTLGVTPVAARVRLHRALAKLKPELEVTANG